MVKQKIKKKLVFLGDTNSINIELIIKSFKYVKKKVFYVVICNKRELLRNTLLKNSQIEINEIFDPIEFNDYKKDSLNIYNIENKTKKKYLNLLNQISISNYLANLTKFDLITMPIDKSIFKRKINFIGMTEHLGSLNKTNTIMLLHGEKFSVIPITTHINLKDIFKSLKKSYLNSFIRSVLLNLQKDFYKLKYKYIKFLCFNPHCGENGTLGNEDILIRNIVKKYSKIKGIYSADSAFQRINKNTLFISTYHDQALIPFKILNRESLNITLGLNYRRLSPAHGTAKDIKNKNIADNTSYIKCLLF
tara:strand:- start:903 stop:1820 length:918 start_codon:yes stop_codon:yes gene_type:complete